MTYNEYTTKTGAFNPATIFATMQSASGVSFADLFIARFGEREIIVDDVTKFALIHKMYTAINCGHFKNIIAGIESANADLIKDDERIIKAFAAPNGALDTSYITGATQEKETGNKNDLQQILNYVTEIASAFEMALNSFEPLFVGVY